MKIRIFALAKELKMDSKLLIDSCQKAGIDIKASALASISEAERQTVLDYLKTHSTTTASPQEPLAPVRARAARGMSTKVPAIKSKARPTTPKMPPKQVEEVASLAEEVASLAEEVASVAVAPPKRRQLRATPGIIPGPLSKRLSKKKEPAEPLAEPSAVPPGSEPDPMAPISRDDYIPASGTTVRSIVPMVPRGTDERSGRTSKAKTSRQLPKLAQPTQAPTVATAKTAESPAQKPDLRLPAEIAAQAKPLQAFVKKQAEEKKGGKKSITSDRSTKDVPRRSGARRGVGLIADRESRQRNRKRRGGRDDDLGETGRGGRRTRGGMRKRRTSASVPLKTHARIELPITVRSLSEAIGRPARALVAIMFDRGEPKRINDSLSEEAALELAMECGVDLEIRHERDIEQELIAKLEGSAEAQNQITRPPIVTILGHVDHGKTTLLDQLRSANVAAGEAGGITQHIAAYQVEHNGQKVTFVDTPGHAAFGEMRARGANVTDIVVLVVAADDGVMPQTIEAINHARAAEVPIIVALNKIDLPGVDEQRILQQLSANDVLPAEWGGDCEVVRTSALTGLGLDDLLDTILVTAELHGFTGNSEMPAHGVCLEAFRDEGRGALAWLIVQQGSLNIGDVVLCGPAFGRIRAMYDDHDQELTTAEPSRPVRVAGLDIVPGAGDHFFEMSDSEEAREAAEARRYRGRAESLASGNLPRTMEDILIRAKEEGVQDLPLIIKADTPGSIEALQGELNKLDHPEVRIKLLHHGVGGVNESDVYLASATGAIIVAFHVVAEDRAVAVAASEGVEIRRYSIIYEVTDEIKRVLEGLLKPELREMPTGRALVLKTFHITRFGTVAGCRVLNGTIDRTNRVHLIRQQTILNDYAIASLKREKDDAKEVREGMECGIRLDGFNDVKEGDLLEAFRVDEIQRTLD